MGISARSAWVVLRGLVYTGSSAPLFLHDDPHVVLPAPPTRAGCQAFNGGGRLTVQQEEQRQSAIRDLPGRDFPLSLARGEFFQSRQTLRAAQAARGDGQHEKIGEEAAAVQPRSGEGPSLLQSPLRWVKSSLTVPQDGFQLLTGSVRRHVVQPTSCPGPWAHGQCSSSHSRSPDRTQADSRPSLLNGAHRSTAAPQYR